jgi:3-oxoacyl-[acyl-carrier-protein] synthase III
MVHCYDGADDDDDVPVLASDSEDEWSDDAEGTCGVLHVARSAGGIEGGTVGVLEDAARAVLAKAGKTEADVDWLIPHQANIRIMQSTAKKLKLSMDKVVVTVDQHGNTSAASIPLALDVAVRSGTIKKGDTLMLEGVGGGFTWGAVLLDY